MRTSRILFPLLLGAGLVACRQQAPVPPPAPKPLTVPASSGEDSGALSSDAKPARAAQVDVLKGTDWPPIRVTSGEASISCEAEDPAPEIVIEPPAASPRPVPREAAAPVPAAPEAEAGTSASAAGQGEPAAGTTTDAAAAAPVLPGALSELDFKSVSAAVAPCREKALVRVRYKGKIGSDFTALMQRVSAMADRLHIGRRILDIDSTGGRVEDAMPAGDAIAESQWTIRVRQDAICHSACVLVLAAGDDRRIAGRIGIHRMIRVGSKANTRAELSQELREVYGEMKDYLERNGASVAVADLMMTVPNRSLRLLSETELKEYGLSGENAVQDDLDRIRLARRCGDEFVKRRDAYQRDYDRQCTVADPSGQSALDLEACAKPLREQYGFPDAKCLADSPVAVLPATQARAGAVAAEEGRH
ncbi:hypothetical protein [Luteimonas aquatica]|uniref:COG3904 family protein n=1 Tax=Luteimonas aquatica TaxID=450364 RepID=UPI001F57A9DA|nr:hypothetical protein [Luteimonas aquatica]